MKKLSKSNAIKRFPVGTRVRYSREFLRNICDYSHETASRTGTVSGEVKSYSDDFHIVPVKWDDDAFLKSEDGTECVNCANLVESTKLHLEPA